MPILTRYSAKRRSSISHILYVDGFAGPGEYEGGEPGSPIIALEAALKHSHTFPLPVRFLFIEEDEARFQHLQQVLETYRDRITESGDVEIDQPKCGDCAVILAEMLDQCQRAGTPFGPAFAFLDQFGYSAVPLKLIGRIMRYPACEVFSYLDWRDMNRFITGETKWPSFCRTFGGEGWKEAIKITPDARQRHLLKTYVQSLKNRARVEFSCHFSMHDENGNLLYWLFFCSGSLRGLEEMKTAMWKVDETGSFRFSDAESPGQLRLLEGYDQEWLAEALSERYRPETVSRNEIKKHVLVETPCRLFIKALAKLEREGRIVVVNPPLRRRRGTFPELGVNGEPLRIEFL